MKSPRSWLILGFFSFIAGIACILSLDALWTKNMAAGRAARQTHNYDNAERYFNRSRLLALFMLPPKPLKRAESLSALGEIHQIQKNPKKVVRTYEALLNIYDRKLAVDYKEKMKILAVLAPSYQQLAAHAKTQEAYRRMLELREKNEGEKKDSYAAILLSLQAGAARAQGKNAEADLLSKKSLDINYKQSSFIMRKNFAPGSSKPSRAMILPPYPASPARRVP